MNPQAIRKLQASLGLPATGVLDTATTNAMTKAVTKAISKNNDVAKYAGTNDPLAILNAYQTGDWSGITSLSGKPFTDAQQKAAVAQAEAALAPAYKEVESFDRSVLEDTLRGETEGLGADLEAEAKQFGRDKDVLDQNAADNGVLFAGSRVQKLNDLRTTYADRDAMLRKASADRLKSTLRGHQYDYGNEGLNGLQKLYREPGATSFNPNVPGGGATRSKTLSTVYDPAQFDFQGRKPVAQKAAVQTRAASLLANRANKLSLSGIGAKF